MKLDLTEEYKMSEEEHKIVLENLKKNVFLNKVVQKNPSIMFVIGQPGCGKTTFIKNENLSKYIIINSDEYRQFNKYSDEILEKFPTDYAKLTNYDAHLWGDELFSYAVKCGYSVLREKAPTDYSLLELIKKLPKEYDIVINVVVSGNLESLLRTRERYEKEILKIDNAKLSNIEAHNKIYEILPDFISRCLSLGVRINYVVTDENLFQTIPIKENYLEILKKYRDESNKNAYNTYYRRLSNIKNKMWDRSAPQEQFDELKKMEAAYLEISNLIDNNEKK